MRVGDLELVALDDGLCTLPQAFYLGLDFATHPELLAEDGRVHIPIGCFLLRTGGTNVLVDSGLGEVQVRWGRGGRLPAALGAVGVDPAEVDVVLCSHLHIDHIGGLLAGGAPAFPNATVRYGSADWQGFVADVPEDDPGRRTMEVLAEAGRLEPLEGDQVAVAPGLTARHTPGHTPGHYGFVVSSGDERAVLLGDAVECPLQLEEPDLSVISDVDPALAARTREAMWRELEGTETLMGAAHFPELRLGRVLAGEGKRWFVPS